MAVVLYSYNYSNSFLVSQSMIVVFLEVTLRFFNPSSLVKPTGRIILISFFFKYVGKILVL